MERYYLSGIIALFTTFCLADVYEVGTLQADHQWLARGRVAVGGNTTNFPDARSSDFSCYYVGSTAPSVTSDSTLDFPLNDGYLVMTNPVNVAQSQMGTLCYWQKRPGTGYLPEGLAGSDSWVIWAEDPNPRYFLVGSHKQRATGYNYYDGSGVLLGTIASADAFCMDMIAYNGPTLGTVRSQKAAVLPANLHQGNMAFYSAPVWTHYAVVAGYPSSGVGEITTFYINGVSDPVYENDAGVQVRQSLVTAYHPGETNRNFNMTLSPFSKFHIRELTAGAKFELQSSISDLRLYPGKILTDEQIYQIYKEGLHDHVSL